MKKTCGEFGGKTESGEPCGRSAGWNTDHVGEGPCADHEDQGEVQPGKCGETTQTGDPCTLPAGWGTDHPGRGACRHHGGGSGENGSGGPEQRREEFEVIQGQGSGADDLPFPEPTALWNSGRDAWRKMAKKLRARGILEDLDEEALYMMAQAYQFAEVMGATLMSDGLVGEDQAHGDRPRKHPAFQMWRESLDRFYKFAKDFGLTPAKREEMELTEVEKEKTRMEKILDRADR